MYSPNLEAVKEVARWCILAVAAFIFSALVDQIKLVPEFVNLKLWVFTFTLPVQAIVWFVATNALRYIDKLKFMRSKLDKNTETSGLLWF